MQTVSLFYAKTHLVRTHRVDRQWCGNLKLPSLVMASLSPVWFRCPQPTRPDASVSLPVQDPTLFPVKKNGHPKVAVSVIGSEPYYSYILFFSIAALPAVCVTVVVFFQVRLVVPTVGVIVITKPSTPVPIPDARVSVMTPSVTDPEATSFVALNAGTPLAPLSQEVRIPPASWEQRPIAVLRLSAAVNALPTFALTV